MPNNSAAASAGRGGGRGRSRGRGRSGRGSGATIVRHGGTAKNRRQQHEPGAGNPPIAPPEPTDQPEAENAEEPSPHTVCLVCCDETLPNHRAILPCGHDDVCGPCQLRLRYLNADRRCPVCKTTNDRIIVDADPPPVADAAASGGSSMVGDDKLDEETHTHKPFGSYEMWGDE